MTALVVDNIGSLVTNDPTLGRGRLGIVENASVVIADGVVEAVALRETPEIARAHSLEAS